MDIMLMVFWYMTGADLTAFRCCCMAFNNMFTENAATILCTILGNRDYQTITALYGTVQATPGPLFFQCLRRCEIAEALVQTIAKHYVRRKPLMRKALAKNVKPYVLSLGHFFEEFRSGLVNHVNGPLYRGSNPMLADRLELQILSTYYNRETAQRICLTYTMINRILSQRFSGRFAIRMCKGARPFGPSFNVPNDIYTFGGLELVKDIVTRVRPVNDSVASHLAKMVTNPEGTVYGFVPLPPSVPGLPLSWDTTLKIRDLLPFQRSRFPFWDPSFFDPPRLTSPLWHPSFFDPPPNTREEERSLNREFWKYLKSYQGMGSELVNHGVVVDRDTGRRFLQAAMVGDSVFDDSETDWPRHGSDLPVRTRSW